MERMLGSGTDRQREANKGKEVVKSGHVGHLWG